MNRSGFFYDLLSTLFERTDFARAKGDGRSITELCEDLIASQGEVSGDNMGRQILTRFSELTPDGEIEFFNYLTEHMDIDTGRLQTLAASYQAERSPETFASLVAAAEPKRQELLRRINRVQGATGELVKMRSRLLRLLKDHPSFGRTDLDFQHLFGSWFNRGFLLPRRIHWQSPANILEKIIKYEAVHAIDDWDDLRRRVEPADRRCYAFFHPAMPDDPLIFVEVALVRGVPNSVQAILAENREILNPESADTAVFYSISNCQTGLRGVSFGNSLIKQVVEDLRAEVKSITTFVTLSPIPGLNRWLRQSHAAQAGAAGGGDLEAAVESAIETGDLAGLRDQAPWLRRQAADYLVNQKDRHGMPLDPVARFHLGNGAMIHDIHAAADLSPNGVRQSCGLMVNYLYDLKKISQFHEGFAENHTVFTSREVRALADAAAANSNSRKAKNGA
ncbi:malonyl-CoA decarboxylase [Hoeflea marina]|uniref:Malonyl-CoA decarboxylase n=1 Tax=Hoeflea marina TaxID=274592 RepID=A0A317PL27_9HYPH|nr:malonyl-CoA decarboxylase [Hoeflea marina]PWW00375.1 malonyl-CoA decarboxylase [Hoeflea marina]